MIIGLTYDLRQDYLAQGCTMEEVVEFDSLETIEALEKVIKDLGHRPVRIGSLPRLAAALLQGQRWDMVFNIAEGRGGFGREAQVPALLEYFGVPYTFSDPLTLSLTLHKGMAKRVARDAGVPTPDFAVVERMEQVKDIAMAFPLFAKPVAEGTGRGISPASRMDNPKDLAEVCEGLLASHGQPVLVESFLPGREFTVGILGSGEKARALGVMEVILRPEAKADVYSMEYKENFEDFVDYRLAAGPVARETEKQALAAWRALGCLDGGRVDLRCDKNGVPNFMEVNPLAGLHPVHSDLPIMCGLLGIEFRELIAEILDSAILRAERSASRIAGGARVYGPAAWRPEKIAIGQCAS